jgi:hypothetical protein
MLAFGHRVRAGGALDASTSARPGTWSPRALTQSQNETVIALADVIIPETDTPGAAAVRVNEFVDLILADWFSEEERGRFLAGIEDVDARTRREFNRTFVACSPEQKIATVAALDAEVDALRQTDAADGDAAGGGVAGGDAADGDPTEHFFYQMKRLTLTGFFTSEVGLELLGYEVVPGTFEGCVLLDEFAAGGGS